MTRALLVFPLVLLLGACGDDEPSGGGGNGGASSSTGSPSSSTGASGATGGSGGSGASGGAGGAGGGACDILEAEPSLGTVTFRVKNDGDRTVYLDGGGECTDTFTITAPGIDTETAQIIGAVACEQVSPTYQGGFPADCLEVESGITLDPGEEETFEWSGLLRESITVPDACAPPNETGAFCQRGLTAPAGPLTVHFRRYETIFVNEREGTQYPTDELPQADVEFTHPTTEVIIDVSLFNEG
jgi:hypothetical protein